MSHLTLSSPCWAARRPSLCPPSHLTALLAPTHHAPTIHRTPYSIPSVPSRSRPSCMPDNLETHALCRVPCAHALPRALKPPCLVLTPTLHARARPTNAVCPRALPPRSPFATCLAPYRALDPPCPCPSRGRPPCPTLPRRTDSPPEVPHGGGPHPPRRRLEACSWRSPPPIYRCPASAPHHAPRTRCTCTRCVGVGVGVGGTKGKLSMCV